MADDPYTSSARLCDDDGIVRRGLMHHGTDYTCTGHAHFAGEHYRCESPAHAVATIPAFDSDTDDVRAGIDAYLRSLADQGDALVKVSEVVAYVRSLAGSSYPEKRGKLHDVADDIERRFATDPRRKDSR